MASDTPQEGALVTPAYPEPLVFEPLQEHRQTFLILHGRGSFAAKFAPPLLEMVASGESLPFYSRIPMRLPFIACMKVIH